MNFVIVTNKDYEFFIDELVNAFPEIREEVLDEDSIGSIHMQVGDFTRFTQHAIDTNNVPVALKCFQFVDDIISKVSDRVKDALEISWVFHLSFIRNENLYKQFPSALKEFRVKWKDKEAEYSKRRWENKS